MLVGGGSTTGGGDCNSFKADVAVNANASEDLLAQLLRAEPHPADCAQRRSCDRPRKDVLGGGGKIEWQPGKKQKNKKNKMKLRPRNISMMLH